jgi:hypothetical protein
MPFAGPWYFDAEKCGGPRSAAEKVSAFSGRNRITSVGEDAQADCDEAHARRSFDPMPGVLKAAHDRRGRHEQADE